MELKKLSLAEFDSIYTDMQQQFPANELKSLEYMRALLSGPHYTAWGAFEENGIVGYTIICSCNDSIFVEYLAVLAQYHSKGYGRQIIAQLTQVYPGCAGCYFEVEHEDPQQPNTARRIRFYRSLGCRLVTDRYFLPYPGGLLEMNLFYLPYHQQSQLPFQQVFSDLKTVFPLIYGRLPEHTGALAGFQQENQRGFFPLT